MSRYRETIAVAPSGARVVLSGCRGAYTVSNGRGFYPFSRYTDARTEFERVIETHEEFGAFTITESEEAVQ